MNEITQKTNKAKIKKIGKIIFDVILYVFIAICILSVVMTITAKKGKDGTSQIFGVQMRIVTSDSMAKCEITDVSDYKIKSIPIRSMIFIQLVPEDEEKADEWYGDLKEGDVLTFKYVYTEQVTITHRITKITEKETGGFIIELAGDNKNSESGQLYQKIDTSDKFSTNYVIGKVTGKAYLLGLFISLAKTPVGIVFIIMVPCLVIIVLEVLKITNVFVSEKKQIHMEEQKKKDDELEELRRRLAELEKQQNPMEKGD